MEKTLFRFVVNNSWRDQVVIVIASLVSFPIILASLYIPKIIVDDALKGEAFPVSVLGFSIEQIEYLLLLCGCLLALIFLNNGVKYFINILKGLTGERILRRIRYTVYDRITRFPLKRLRKTSPGEVVQVVAAEVEPIGGFAGEMVATPVYQGGQLIVYLGFIIAQDPILGLAAIILFPVQAYVIPKVQRIVVGLVQARIRNVREMTGEISESIQGAEEMRLSAAQRWHLARISERLYTNFKIRWRIFKLKFAIKFANNVINHITPFFFYSFGGYLVIQGRMELGALVAILAAYKDIASPWKSLLGYYQTFSDISARYIAVLETYGQEQTVDTDETTDLEGKAILFDGIGSETPIDAGGVRDVSLTLDPGKTVALVGEEEGGRTVLLRLMSGLLVPERGTLRIAGSDAGGRDALTRAGRQVSYVSRNPHILSGSFRDNVAYGVLAHDGQGERPADWVQREREARLTGAIPDTPDMDWIDYDRAGVPDAAAFDDRAIQALRAVGLEKELFDRGLWTTISDVDGQELAASALTARTFLRERVDDEGLADLIEPWATEVYLMNASVAENLFFGSASPRPKNLGDLVEIEEVRRVIRAIEIEGELIEMGIEAAETLLDLIGSLGRDTSVLDKLGLIQQSDAEIYAEVLSNAKRRGAHRLRRVDKHLLIGLAFQLTPMRHRLGVLDEPARQERIIAARQKLREIFRPPPNFRYLDESGYVFGLPLIENILGGRPRIDRREAMPSIETRLETVMEENELHKFVVTAGLRSEVGLGGNTLSPMQRRKVALARAIVSRPSVLVLDGVADDMSAEDHELRRVLRELLPDTTLVIGSSAEELAGEVDCGLRIAGGRATLVEATKTHQSELEPIGDRA